MKTLMYYPSLVVLSQSCFLHVDNLLSKFELNIIHDPEHFMILMVSAFKCYD